MELDIIVKLIIVLLAVHDLLSIIVRLTKTPKDDDINNKFGKLLNIVLSATNNLISTKELHEKVAGATAIRALDELQRKAKRREEIVYIDELIKRHSKSTARYLDNGYDLIPDVAVTIPGKIANIVSNTVKNKNMKTKLGKRVQKLFRRID